MARQTEPKRTEPKAWERAEPGIYRSSDGRYTISQEGPGRWFVADSSAHDELGLPRLLGPFRALADAREAAAEQRLAPRAESPLNRRLEAARERSDRADAAGGAKPSGRSRARNDAPEAPAAEAPAAEAPEAEAPAQHPAPSPARPSWLDRLPRDDAMRARRLVAMLERAGFASAERLVRRDMEADLPAVARAILARRIREAAIEPWQGGRFPTSAHQQLAAAVAALRARGVSDDAIAALAVLVARTAVEATLEELTGRERDPSLPGELPGWRLVERGPSSRERRIRLGEEDLG